MQTIRSAMRPLLLGGLVVLGLAVAIVAGAWLMQFPQPPDLSSAARAGIRLVLCALWTLFVARVYMRGLPPVR